MRRHDYTRASLIFSLACMTLFWGYAVGTKPLHASSSRSQEAETLQVAEGSKVTLQYVATVPGSTGLDYGTVSEFIQGSARDLSSVGATSGWNETRGRKDS